MNNYCAYCQKYSETYVDESEEYFDNILVKIICQDCGSLIYQYLKKKDNK